MDVKVVCWIWKSIHQLNKRQRNDYSYLRTAEGVYTIYKEGIEYLQIQKDTESQWLKLDPESGIPLFGLDEEVNTIGQAIVAHENISR